MSLFGRVAIVTGGGTGIGLGISKALSANGATIVLVQKDRTGLQDAASSIAPSTLATVADISNREQVFSLVGWIEQRLGRIDILINNAAVTGKPAVHSFLDCSQQQLDTIVDTNLKGTYYCSQAAAQSMIRTKTKGSIVHISSVGAYAAQEQASMYCATKAAVVSLARSMALELAPHHIRVNAIAPGDILTSQSSSAFNDVLESGGTGKYFRGTPLGRRGTPEDIGNAAAYLVSDEASFVTGATLLVDGGFLSY